MYLKIKTFPSVLLCFHCIPVLKYQRVSATFKACHPGSMIPQESPHPCKWGWTLYPVALVVHVWVNTPEYSLYLEALASDILLLRKTGGSHVLLLLSPNYSLSLSSSGFWSQREKLDHNRKQWRCHPSLLPAVYSEHIFSKQLSLLATFYFNKILKNRTNIWLWYQAICISAMLLNIIKSITDK